MILITGAGGKTGRAVTHALREKGEAVRVLLHHADHTAFFAALGVSDLIIGDMLDPRIVAQAFVGVKAVYHICPNVHPDEVEIGRLSVAAALAAGVQHFVYHSVLLPAIKEMPHHFKKYQIENLLRNSGLSYTILQPTMYMQNILANWDAIRQDGVYAVPYPATTRLSQVDLTDVAEVAAMVLTQPGHNRKTYELCGETLTPNRIAEILSEVLDKKITVECIPLDGWREKAVASGLGGYQLDALLKMFAYYTTTGLEGDTSQLTGLLDRPAATMTDYLQRTKGEENGN